MLTTALSSHFYSVCSPPLALSLTERISHFTFFSSHVSLPSSHSSLQNTQQQRHQSNSDHSHTHNTANSCIRFSCELLSIVFSNCSADLSSLLLLSRLPISPEPGLFLKTALVLYFPNHFFSTFSFTSKGKIKTSFFWNPLPRSLLAYVLLSKHISSLPLHNSYLCSA